MLRIGRGERIIAVFSLYMQMIAAADIADHLFTRKRWALHVLFWLGVFAFYVLFFGGRHHNYLQTFFFVGLLLPVTMGATYLINYYLVPVYLLRERYLRFFVYCAYTLLGILLLEMIVATVTLLIMAGLDVQNMAPASFDMVFLLTSLLLVAFLAVAIKMMLHWRQSKEDYQRLMREKVETELRFLKTQLNPHFLFNTLNNLYYLSTEKSDQTPRAILALSEILDYVLHASRSVLVAAVDECRMVENYVSLEKLRYHDRASIELKWDGSLEHHQMPPMLLMTLLENAFKHGVMPTASNAWIICEVTGEGQALKVSVTNSQRNANPGNGIGLQNLRSQLDLLYPGRYVWRVQNDSTQFLIEIILMKA